MATMTCKMAGAGRFYDPVFGDYFVFLELTEMGPKTGMAKVIFKGKLCFWGFDFEKPPIHYVLPLDHMSEEDYNKLTGRGVPGQQRRTTNGG